MITVHSEQDMLRLGEQVGSLAVAGDMIELIGDVGAGKTTFVRGFAIGMGIDETIQSPSFTISRVYESARGKRLAHYDFYRLNQPGIMADELVDTLSAGDTVIVIEWASAVASVLPSSRLTITIRPAANDERLVELLGDQVMTERFRGVLS